MADKPAFPIAGRIFFLQSKSFKSDWELMCFNCDDWQLDLVCRLPQEFNNTDVKLAYIDEHADEFWMFPRRMDSESFSFYSFKRSSAKGRWYEDPSGMHIFNVMRFGDYVYYTMLVYNGRDDRGDIPIFIVNRMTLSTGEIEENFFQKIFSGKKIVSCIISNVEESITGVASLYFNATYEEGTRIREQYFRIDSPDASPIAVDSNYPTQIECEIKRFPFIEIMAGKNYDYLCSGLIQEGKPFQADNLEGLRGRRIDPKLVKDGRRLIRIPRVSIPLCLSADEEYYLFLQASSKPIESEGLVAVNLETGQQVPILAYLPLGGHVFMTVHWKRGATHESVIRLGESQPAPVRIPIPY